MKIKKVFLFLFAALFAFTSCRNGPLANARKVKSTEELFADLEIQEKKSPLIYLTIDADINENRIEIANGRHPEGIAYVNDGSTISGAIKNTALMAEFKDIVINVIYYSQSGEEIETKDFTINEFFSPKSTNKFHLKVYPPDGMAKFEIEVKSAKAVD